MVEIIERRAQRRGAGRTRQADQLRLRRLVVLGERERLCFRVGEQAVAVHGDAVARAQQEEVLRLGRGFRDFREADRLEGRNHRRHGTPRGLETRGVPERVAKHQLLAAAPARHQSHARLDQAHITLSVRLHRRRVQHDLAAAAERHARGRRHHRERRILDRFVDRLALGLELLDHWPEREVRREQS